MSRKKDAVEESTSTKAVEEEKETVKANVEDVKQTVVYCGASIPKAPLMQYALFNNRIPVYLEPILKELPSIKELFVPVKELNDCKRKIVEQGTAEHTINSMILEYVRSGK